MAKRSQEKFTPEQIVEALNATQGLVYLAADRLRCSAKTVYNYANRYKAVQVVLEHHKGKRLDTAEASLWNAVIKGEAWAVCFYLKTQGKHRGYVERQEIRQETSTLGDDVRKRLDEVDGEGPGQSGKARRGDAPDVADPGAPAAD